MSISVFDIYSIGIGPSSSHTVGPMRATRIFLDMILDKGLLEHVTCIKCDLYGSLALTGKGHGTDKAIILGLEGHTAETINSDLIPDILDNVSKSKRIVLNKVGQLNKLINFDPKDDIKFHRRINLPFHPNGMAFAAFNESGKEICRDVFYSVGGGFIINEEESKQSTTLELQSVKEKYPFNSARELLDICKQNNISIADVMMANELVLRTEDEIKRGVLNFWKVMEDCIARGFKNEGILPGGLNVKRRAPKLYRELISSPEKNMTDTLSILDWVNLYALAVNEENAAGGQVVTAPTNGAAGIIPAILKYYTKFIPKSDEKGIIEFLLTAAAIGILYKKNASISGAEVGCQGEVGVACSMAAAGLAHVLGGTPEQVENAAEIAMEHNLGLTCDTGHD